MTDRIQELRALVAEAAPHLWGATERATLDIAREALDGWEKAEALLAEHPIVVKDGIMGCESLHEMRRQLKRAEQAEADRDTYRAAWNRSDAAYDQLREAAHGWVDSVELIETDGDAVELAQRMRAALTQENPE